MNVCTTTYMTYVHRSYGYFIFNTMHSQQDSTAEEKVQGPFNNANIKYLSIHKLSLMITCQQRKWGKLRMKNNQQECRADQTRSG